jgi:hypothetical protein
VRQYIRTGTAGDVLVPLPTDLPVATVEAVLYGPDGAADWTPAQSVAHPTWALTGAAAAGVESLGVTPVEEPEEDPEGNPEDPEEDPEDPEEGWGDFRAPQPGDELTLTDPDGFQGPTETVIARFVGSNGKLTIVNPLRLPWDEGSILQPRTPLRRAGRTGWNARSRWTRASRRPSGPST